MLSFWSSLSFWPSLRSGGSRRLRPASSPAGDDGFAASSSAPDAAAALAGGRCFAGSGSAPDAAAALAGGTTASPRPPRAAGAGGAVAAGRRVPARDPYAGRLIVRPDLKSMRS
jgi:hypothetical protein